MSSGSVAKSAPSMVKRDEMCTEVEVSSSLPSLADVAVRLLMIREVIWASAHAAIIQVGNEACLVNT